MRTQGKLLPSKLKRQVNTGSHSLPEQNSQAKTASRTSAGVGNLNCDELLKAECRQLGELKTSGGPSHREILTILWGLPPGTGLDSHSKYQKNPLGLPAGGGEKKPFWNTPEHPVLLNKACPQGKLVNQSPTLTGCYQNLTDLRKGKHPTPISYSIPHGRKETTHLQPTLTILSHLRGEKTREASEVHCLEA